MGAEMGYEQEKIVMELELGRTTASATEAAKAVDQLDTSLRKLATTYDLAERETKEYTLAVTQSKESEMAGQPPMSVHCEQANV